MKAHNVCCFLAVRGGAIRLGCRTRRTRSCLVSRSARRCGAAVRVSWLSLFLGICLMSWNDHSCMGADAADAAEADAGGEPPSSEFFDVDPATYSCLACHADPNTFVGDRAHLHVEIKDLESDIHWVKGIRCHDCHGGDPQLDLTNIREHRNDPDFVQIESPLDIPTMCGRCHSDIDYMRQFNPSARTDQETEYWTSGHGQRLHSLRDPTKAKVATCINCHGRHGILAVKDQQSPVYAKNVAETCSKCHANPEIMEGRAYHGKKLGHSQFDDWSQSVHAKAMLERGDTSAPTCNDCHGNHGAVPPDVGSVANACGTCHGKVAGLFGKTRMKHFFDEFSLPGCAVCHGNHAIRSPTDDMLGMGDSHLCDDCHTAKRLGATPNQGLVGKTMWKGLKQLRGEIAAAEATIEKAERLGMEVGGPKFDLRLAQDSLTNARSLIHTFALPPFEEALKEGLEAAETVQATADATLAEHAKRRVWLAASLVPLFLVVIQLLLYIRSQKLPDTTMADDPHVMGSTSH